MQDPWTEFGNRVRALRKAKHLSQEELAARTGFHTNYIGGVERGTINLSLRNAVRIAEVLEGSLTVLIGPPKPVDRESHSAARRLREEVLERLKGQPAKRLAVILDVVKVLTRKAPRGTRP